MDRNKTKLTHDVTTASAHWLEAHGFKPVEAEVPMPWININDTGWIADLASVIFPTQTELIELRMLPRRPRWPGPEHRDDAEKLQRWRENDAEWEAARNPLLRRMTVLVEVKTSRSDFRGDRKWKAPWPTDLAYLAIPKGLVRQDEYPDGWGILEDGERCVRPPAPRTCTLEQHFGVVMAIAIKRDHHTRYARWREVAQQERIERGDRRKLQRMRDLADAVFAVAHGHSHIYGPFDTPEAAVEHYIDDCPAWLMDRMKKIWRLAAQT